MQSVTPINYNLEFRPDLKNSKFTCTEIVTAKSVKPIKSLILNSAELDIKSCIVESNNSKLDTKFVLDENKEQLVIKLGKSTSGTFKITIDFDGILNDKLLGFYKSSFKTSDGKTHFIATTQFEAADARRAFPCWDEPLAKATFDISILAESLYTVISNMPEISSKRIGTKTLHKFDTTPIMSTYLLYLGVGEFASKSAHANNILVRIFATKDNIKFTKFALNLATKILLDYEKYFGIKYPLPKLDLIAVPDFAAGAMENWGAITFRETILLYDSENSSSRTKQFIAEVISHEIAHQWFGNLVTMEWWNDLWLNESFATYMATKFVHKLYPEWNLWQQFVGDATNTAMNIDTLINSHPIDVTVNDPSEIREIFDSISYDKGGSILRMLDYMMGESLFQKGLRNYLNKFKYSNATGDDLWTALQDVSKIPVRSIMHKWLKQTGYPLVRLVKKDNKIIFSQQRFTASNKKIGLWPIPITHGIKSQTILNQKTRIISNSNTTNINPQKYGFYRVSFENYTLFELRNILSNLTDPIDRWALQNDQFALVLFDKSLLQNYLLLLDGYADDRNYLVCSDITSNLNYLLFHLYDEKLFDTVKQFAISYFKKLYDSLGWKPKSGEQHTVALLRSMIIMSLGKLDDKNVLAESSKRFDKFLKNPKSLDANLRAVVFSLVAWGRNDKKTMNQLKKLYKSLPSQEEKNRLLGGMCWFKDKKLLLETLNFSLSPSVRSQNMQLPIMGISSNPYGKSLLWNWLKKNWVILSNKIGHGNPLFNRIVASISNITNYSIKENVSDFFKKNPVPGTQRTLKQVLERIENQHNFKEKVKREFA